MMVIHVDGTRVCIENYQPFVQGTVGLQANVQLSEEWDGLTVTAVFATADNFDTRYPVSTGSGTITIPWEVLSEARAHPLLSFDGRDSGGNLIRRSSICDLGEVAPSMDPLGETPTPTPPYPDWYENVYEAGQQALQSAQDAEAYAKGTRGGTEVETTDPAYHNNSKYFKEQAEAARDSIPADYTELAGDVGELKSQLNKIAEFEIGTNLNNPDTMMIGYMIAWSGNPSEASAYNLSDFIPVTPGKKYSVGVYKPDGALYKTRTMSTFYDANKSTVSGSVTNVDNTEGLLVTAPEGAAFARVSGHTNFDPDVYGLMIAESDTILTRFAPYQETTTIIADIPELDDLAPLIGSTVAKTENHYNSETSTEGFLQYNGTIVANPTGQHYSVSDYISVKPNTTYYVTGYNSSFTPSATRLVAACYDEYKAFVSNTYVNTDSTLSISINSQNYKYIRVCANAELAGRYLMVSEGAQPDMYQEYDLKTYSTLYVEPDKVPDYPVLFGKKWAVCGDSFTNSGGTGTTLTSGKYKGRPFTYPWIIGNRNDMEIVKFFEGGRTLAFPAEPGAFANSITNPNAAYYYQNIPEDVDYITIYLGINDEHHAPNSSGGDGEDNTGKIPLGTIDDSTTATYYGAWNVVLSWLITNRPNAHIGIIVTNGLSIVGYRDAQIAIARKYGIPFIDLNGDDRTPAMLRTVNPNIPSAIKQALINKWAVDPTGSGGTVNTHPNDAAQLYESTFIENFVRSL